MASSRPPAVPTSAQDPRAGPGSLLTAPAAAPEPASCDSCSLASTSGDHCTSDALDASQRTHHLLKHCLSQSQRGAALAQFNTADPRDAAKEIARMGQRELQAKFKEVYGSATKSNNNSWLRRKLYEAVGVAPLKANTKGKTRKSGGLGSAGSRKSGLSKDKARSPKLAAIKTKRVVEAPSASPRPSLPSAGPLSILDLHQQSGLLSNDTSDSEDGDSHAAAPPVRSHSCPSSPLGFAGSAIYAMQQQAMAGTLHSRAAPPQRARALAPAPAGFVPVAEPQSPMAGLHWADGFAAQPRQQSPPPNSAAAAATFFSTGSQSLPCLDVTGLAAFKTMEMDLEQDPTAPWETDKPWYFGSSLDLATLSLPKPLPMDCSSNAASGGDDDDDIPLLTLDLGAIDVSI